MSTNITISRDQAFKSIDAMGGVNEKNVANHKLSYSNDGTEIYVGSSGSAARTFGYYVGGYVGSYNLDHTNLPVLADRISSAITSEIAENKDAKDLITQANRVANAADGLRLMHGKHYPDKQTEHNFTQAFTTLSKTATTLLLRASQIKQTQQQWQNDGQTLGQNGSLATLIMMMLELKQ